MFTVRPRNYHGLFRKRPFLLDVKRQSSRNTVTQSHMLHYKIDIILSYACKSFTFTPHKKWPERFTKMKCRCQKKLLQKLWSRLKNRRKNVYHSGYQQSMSQAVRIPTWTGHLWVLGLANAVGSADGGPMGHPLEGQSRRIWKKVRDDAIRSTCMAPATSNIQHRKIH